MKSVVVLGAGLIGRTIAIDLSSSYEVCSADKSQNALNALSSLESIRKVRCDFSNVNELKKLIEPYDLVIGAVPGYMGFNLLKSVIEAGKNVVDISFFSEDPFALDELAKANNVIAVVDCGVAPGMCNMIAGYYNTKMKLLRYECFVGGLPLIQVWPFAYKAPFSPIDVLAEYTRPARIVIDGTELTVEALSGIETVSFRDAGELEAFYTDGLRTLTKTMQGVSDMSEKTMRFPGHASLMRVFRETGLFNEEKIKVGDAEVSPIDVTAALLFPKWKLNEGEEDFTIMRVTLESEDKRIVYYLYDSYDRESHTSSMARTTGYTCTAVASLILNESYQHKGISPPEFVGKDEYCFSFVIDYLKKRNVEYRKTEWSYKKEELYV